MADNKEVEIVLKGKFENGKLIVDTTKQIDQNLKDIANSSDKAEKQSSNLATTLKRLGAIVGITYLANSFKNLVKGSLEAAGSMEQVNIALTTMLGSGEKAAKLQKELVDFAKKTPFEIEGIFSSTKQLLAYGFAQEEIISTMSTLGNIAAGVGVDMNRLALVFGQVKTAGKLMGQDLLQFTSAGVPLLDALSATLGKSKDEIVKLKENGKISFDDVKIALESLTKEGGKFYNLMENQSKTFLGTVSNMSDSFYQVKVALGEALLPVAKRVVDAMIVFFGNLKDSIEANKPVITAIATAFVSALSLIGKAFSLVFSIIGNFINGLKTIISIPFAQAVLGAAAAVLVFSKGLGVLTIAVRLFTTTAFGWISVLFSIISAIGYLSKGIENMPNFVKIAVLTIGKWWEQLKFTVVSGIEAILDKISTLANVPGFGWVKQLQDDFKKTKEGIINNVDEINSAIQALETKSVASPDMANPANPDAPSPSSPTTAKIDPKAKLDALKAEHDALLEEQKRYLGEFDVNEKNAAQLSLDNQLLANQQKLLSDGDYAEKKKELDNMLLNDEIALEDYKQQMQALANDAKSQLLQEQYDEERKKFIENQALMDEIKNEMQATQDEAELTMLQSKLDAITEKQTAQNQRLLELKIKKDEADLKQDKKKGDLELKFNKVMDDERLKGAQKAANELVALQNSKNKQLAAIGKAAAIFQITVDTAKGAMSAYSGTVSALGGGPWAVAAGAAMAAVVTAYGLERIAQASGASYAVGTDNIPSDHMAMVHQGEMIIPATFAEAIRAGDLSLSGGSSTTNNSSSQASTSIIINFEGANFYGKIEDSEIAYIGERLGQLITENIITPIPTRRA